MEESPTNPAPQTHEERMEQMLSNITVMLHHMDRRDRARMFWGTFHALLGIIPLVLFLYGAWYFAQHGTQLIQQMTEQTMRNMIGGSGSASSGASSAPSFFDQIKQYMN